MTTQNNILTKKTQEFHKIDQNLKQKFDKKILTKLIKIWPKSDNLKQNFDKKSFNFCRQKYIKVF